MAVTFGLAQHGGVDLAVVAQSVVGTALFLVVSFTLGRRVVFFLIRWANDTLISEVPVITTILVVMGIMALITHAIGVHTILGAFVAGILVGQSPILSRHIDEQLRGLITALFMPVFFGVAGLNADLRVLEKPSLLLLALGFIAIASLGKFSGAFVGGALSGLTWRESLALGWGMNARGSTEVIVASLGLSMGALSQDLFTIIVTMAVVTTMAMPPMLRWALARLPLRDEEKARIEREEFEARGFISNVERLLVAVDDSASGKFASRLAGLLSGSQRITSTVLQFASGADDAQQRARLKRAGKAGAIVEDTASAAEIESAHPAAVATPVEITTRQQAELTEQAIAEEARKGYDLLLIGVEPAVSPDGEIDAKIAGIAAAFEGPVAIAVARGLHAQEPAVASRPDILVPITGTNHSRRGAEVAVALARASLGRVTMLHVASRERLSWRTDANEAAILRDAVQLGDQFGVPIRTAISAHADADEAILSQLRGGEHDLIVMGVSPRPGATLSYGRAAAAILQRSNRSVLLVAS
jgi:hypothetical protein